MSIKGNIVASYASQIYVTLIGFAMVPVYLRYMDIESYGLVGFFIMLQAWFQLLDLGLTSTISREAARHAGGVGDALRLRRLLRLLEVFFAAMAFLGAGALWAGSSWIASDWLSPRQMPSTEVEHAVRLMAVLVALRWICGLYRGAISGFERLVWLSSFNSAAATIRFVLVVPYMAFAGASAVDFFRFQLMVGMLELVTLVFRTYRLLPSVRGESAIPWQWHSLRDALKFSLGVALTSSIWVFVTQTDKLILSRLLSLGDYAYFTLAVMVAGSITLIGAPISAAVLPRMTRLCAENDDAGLIRVYRSATQLVGVIAVPLTLVLAVFARQVLWAWTGNAEVATQAAPSLTLYALGNGILAFAAFPYYLQFAKGDLKLHIIGHLLFVVLLMPALVLATLKWGVIGAGYAWLSANMAYFIGWIPRVHRRFYLGLHTQWLGHDLGPIVALCAAGAWLAQAAIGGTVLGRAESAASLVLVALALLCLAAAGSTQVRAVVRLKFRAKTA